MARFLPLLLLGAAATTAQLTSVAASRHPTTAKPTHSAKHPAITRTYSGIDEPMQWGPVQVTIVVQGKKIARITASAPTERVRSAIINRRALPILAAEALKAQNAHVSMVSGATLTSEAYITSLQAALKKAHL